MNKQEIAAAVSAVLQKGHDLRCELGTVRLVEVPAYEGRNPRTGEPVAVPARRYPIFAPSARLIAAVFGGGNIPVAADRYENEPQRPDEARLYNLATADPHGDWVGEESIEHAVGGAIEEISVGEEILRDIGDALRQGKKFGMSGFGTFQARRLARRKLDEQDARRLVDADLRGKWIVTVRFSHVLVAALNHAAIQGHTCPPA